MKQEIQVALQKALGKLGIENAHFKLDYPENAEHGDFSSNAAMVYAKQLSLAPKTLAEQIIVELKKVMPDVVESVSVAGPGFINFKIKDKVFAKEIVSIVTGGAEYGWGKGDTGKKVIVEHTDPNTYKPFHIGHLMATTIGESISRIVQASGAEVVRMCYPSDIGLHIAKSVWAWKKNSKDTPADTATSWDKTIFLGKMYVEGTLAYDADTNAKSEIDLINKALYEKSDSSLTELYNKGRQWSLDYYETLYKKFGTTFNEYIFESEIASIGKDIVRSYLDKGVFEESDGAVVFKGEKYGLHTRVFINSQGFATYEGKEVGLNITKFKRHPDTTLSIIVTANEINEYFKVLLKCLSLIDDNVSSKTLHVSHGMLRFASGKMSSRTGNVVLAESLIGDIQNLVMEKIQEREFSVEEKNEIAEIVAVGAIKYTILRQATGGDVIFDSSASISFEGDSGPYLQYAAVRAGAVLEKGKKQEAGSRKKGEVQVLPESVTLLEKLISRFPDIVERARAEYAPQTVANYLISLAGAFNSYYASNQIIIENDPLTSYRLDLTQAFLTTMTNGLWLLGIKVPKKM
jgi:arginyl-tRNA synthetase